MAKQTAPKKDHFFWFIVGLGILIVAVIFISRSIKPLSSIQPFPSSTAQTFNFAKQQFSADNMQLNPQEITNYTVSPDGSRAAAILVENFGGSGTFYYLVGAMNSDGQTVYSQPQSIGDRIIITSVIVDAPEEHDNGEITVEYLDRKPTDTMASTPTVKKTLKFSFENNGDLITVLE